MARGRPSGGDPMPASLVRNRNYELLWGRPVVSEFGISTAAIDVLTLVFEDSGAPAAAGLGLGTAAAAGLLGGLPAGALMHRWNRKKIMLGCEAVQAVAAASIVGALWWDVLRVPHLLVVATVIGICGALFQPAEEASLPNVVPKGQLSTAVAMNSARGYLGQLSGSAAGGFLFAVGRLVPFAVDALTHTMAFLSLLFLRLPGREVTPQPVCHLGREMAEGLRWVWQQHRVRVVALCAVGLNTFFSAYYLVIIALAVHRGVPS